MVFTRMRRLLILFSALFILTFLSAPAAAEYAESGLARYWPKADHGRVEYVQGDRMYFHVSASGGFSGRRGTGLTASGVLPGDLYADDGSLLPDMFLYKAAYINYAEVDTSLVEPGDYRFYFIDVYMDGGLPQADYIYQDISVRGAEYPSGWAGEYVSEAISRGLIPLSLQNRYTSDITRDDFARLIVTLVERKTGVDIVDCLERRGLSLDYNPFSDVNDDAEDFQDHILAAYKLGIIFGRGTGVFDPEGFITRQEAAAMLQRTALALGSDVSYPRADYSDVPEGSWAEVCINFTNGAGIMKGIAPGLFNPDGAYSYEQAYTTMIRMYNLQLDAGCH